MKNYANWPHGLPIPAGDDWEGEHGLPGIALLGNAIQVWSILQAGKTTIRQCAAAFNLDDAQVRAAVEEHYWMYISGPDDDPEKQLIEHEGE